MTGPSANRSSNWTPLKIQSVVAALGLVGRLTAKTSRIDIRAAEGLFQLGYVQLCVFFSRITLPRSHHALCPLTLTIIPQVIRLASALPYYIILQLKRAAEILTRSRMGRVGFWQLTCTHMEDANPHFSVRGNEANSALKHFFVGIHL